MPTQGWATFQSRSLRVWKTSGQSRTTRTEFLREQCGMPTTAVDDWSAANPETLAKYSAARISPGPPQLSPAIDELVAAKTSALDLTKGVVLDGYPASKHQADRLAAL